MSGVCLLLEVCAYTCFGWLCCLVCVFLFGWVGCNCDWKGHARCRSYVAPVCQLGCSLSFRGGAVLGL